MSEKISRVTRSEVFNAAEAREGNLLGRRLQEERRAMKLSLDEMSERLEEYGVSVKKAAVSKWENGTTVPGAYQLMAVCALFGIDDPVAYFSGAQSLNEEGMRKLAEYRADLIATGKYAPENVNRKIRCIQMPVSFFTASAGTGDFLDENSFEMVSFPESAVPEGADFALRVNGDSMEPVYTGGQIVWVKKCTRVEPGEVGIFILDGSGYIKMYDERVPDNPEDYTDVNGVVHMQPVLVSYNENYAPIVVPVSSRLEIAGKVL